MPREKNEEIRSTHQRTTKDGTEDQTRFYQQDEYSRYGVTSKQEFKRQLTSDKPSKNELLAKEKRNKKEAVKEVLQENVKAATKVKNEGLINRFNSGRRS